MRILPLAVRYFIYVMIPFGGHALYETAGSCQTEADLAILFDNLPIESAMQGAREAIHKLFRSSWGISARTLRSFLQTSYPFISHVRLWYHSKSKACIHIKAAQPCALINTVYVLTEDGNIFYAAWYKAEAYRFLPQIATSSPILLASPNKELAIFAKSLPPAFHQHYTFDWHDKTHIFAQDKLNPSITLILTQETLKEDKPWKALKLLIAQLLERNQQLLQRKQKKARQKWIIDIRCADRIIVLQQKG